MEPQIVWSLGILFAFLFQAHCARLFRTSYAGPYSIKFANVSRCNFSEPMPLDLFVHCSERNKAGTECKKVNGNLTVRRDFPNDIPATITLNQWRDKEWKKDGVIMRFARGIKAAHDHLSDWYRSILGDVIQLKKGVYKVDAPLKLNLKSIPVFPYGRWKGQMLALDSDSKPNFCTDFIIDIVPKI